jgi:hypothetical protein
MTLDIQLLPWNMQKNVARLLAAASDKVYQLLAHGRWFSPASSTTKTGRHDIAEIFLQVVLNTINQIKSNTLTESTLPHFSACSKVRD